MKLEELNVYNLAMELGNEIWGIVKKWDYFERDTMGRQLIKAVDSVAANISEGFGRYHYKDVKNFAYYSRGSLFETKTWLSKANKRKLITDDEYSKFINRIDDLGVRINNYINSTGKTSRLKNRHESQRMTMNHNESQ